MNDNITILSVNFATQFELESNISLMRLNNTGDLGFRWIIADNSIEESPFVKKPSMRDVDVVEGVSKKAAPQMGEQHGEALNLLIRKVDTEFALILDPDFYVFNENWLGASLEFMRQRDLTFFGSPWHSATSRQKWYDFPNCHFLMIDMRSLDREILDFRPALSEKFLDPVTQSRDTGYRIRRTFKDDPARKSELMESVDMPELVTRIFENAGISSENLAKTEFYRKGDWLDAFHFRRTQSLVQIFGDDLGTTKALFEVAEVYKK
jgi:hypothetical protein